MSGIFDAEVYGTCQHCRMPVGTVGAVGAVGAVGTVGTVGRQLVARSPVRSPGRQVARSPGRQ
eukprot:6105040-Prymnesium_polylepis.1